MKFVTFQTRPGPGGPRPTRFGILDGDTVREVPGSLLGRLREDDGLAQLRALGPSGFSGEHRLGDVALRAPLPRPNSMRDFMLVEEHVKGSLGEVPAEWYRIPVYWKGNCDTVIGPEATVPWPYYTDKLDFELELGAVIGRRAFRVDVGEAAECIAGFTVFNDWSARDIQMREMSVGLGVGLSKDFATSLGPCLVTPDEFDVTTARMRARVNGEVWSEGTLGGMRFSFPEVISHLSQEQPLQPGDVLGSGTVARGCGLELDRWIRPGDTVELEVDGIGVLRNVVGPKNPPPGPGAGIPSILRPAAPANGA
ncbi:fumarylacetoacetate hydrolase family protein [Pseudonocardia sp. NPDC049635]|uniref:fumarylacetoacetate hydrolase family protein n=1 Tax=Pseudonocardia sp. NPDC049635 TaxID=3155506 RepID=UPI0033F02F1E